MLLPCFLRRYLASLGILLWGFSSQAQDFRTLFPGNADSLRSYAHHLIAQPAPTFPPATSAAPDSATLADLGLAQVYTAQACSFGLRDHCRLAAYRYPGPAATTILLLHGVASTATLYNQTAGLLRQATQATVYAVDLRGHGRSEGKPGDVAYLNQYADDVADLVASIRREKPGGKLILAGHSMGGGIALRYAQAHPQGVEGLLLLAPLLGQDFFASVPPAPATPAAPAADAFMQLHLPRIMGLKMLNSLGQHELDSLPVLFFNLPPTVPLRQYSYRANQSMAPEYLASALRAVRVPLLVVIGSRDEAFAAAAVRQAVVASGRGQAYVVAGATHNGIRHHPQTYRLVHQWAAQL